MKGNQFDISSDFLGKANGRWECYNLTENMVHLARVGKNGEKLSPRAKNLMNIAADNFAAGIEAGRVAPV